MGFNDKFALQTILNGVRFGSWLFSNSGGTLALPATDAAVVGTFALYGRGGSTSLMKPLHRKFDLLENTPLLKKWVSRSFVADGAGRTMAAYDRHVVPQAQELVLDRLD
jgi:hypothetical protein